MAERGSPPPAKSAVFLSLYEIPLELDHGDDIAVMSFLLRSYPPHMPQDLLRMKAACCLQSC